MAWKPFLLAVWHLIEPLVPAALGAAVAQAWEPALGWRQRLIQWSVGVLVAAFIVPAIGVMFGWSQPLTNAAGFVIGMLAFKAVPAISAGVLDAAGDIPDWAGSWLRRPGGAAAPSRPDGGRPGGDQSATPSRPDAADAPSDDGDNG